MPCSNFPQKALWFPERKDWLPSMCGRGPSGVGAGCWETVWHQDNDPRKVGGDATQWRSHEQCREMCVPEEAGPRWSRSSPNVLQMLLTKKCQKVCALCCMQVMSVHCMSYVCMLLYMCMLYTLIYLHYVCYVRMLYMSMYIVYALCVHY